MRVSNRDHNEAADCQAARTIRILYLYKFLLNFQLWMPIWIVYLQHERGLSLTQITAMEVPFQVTVLLAQIPTGALADRWGRRFSLLIGGAAYAAGIFLFGVGTSYWWILVSYLVWAFSSALASGADSALLHDALAAQGREGEFSREVGRLQACFVTGGLISTLLGAPLAAATSLALPIFVSSGVILAATAVLLALRQPERHGTAATLPYLQLIGTALRYTAGHRELRTMIVLNALLVGLSMAAIVFLFQPFLLQQRFPLRAFGLLSAPMQLLAVVALLGGHRLRARMSERRLVVALTGCTIAGLLVLGLTAAPTAILAFFTLRVCTGLLYPFVGDYVNRHSPDELRATVSSVLAMAVSAVMAVAAPLQGVLSDRFSLQTALLVCGVLEGALAGTALIAWLAETRREQPDTTPVAIAARGQ